MGELITKIIIGNDHFLFGAVTNENVLKKCIFGMSIFGEPLTKIMIRNNHFLFGAVTYKNLVPKFTNFGRGGG
jgi:hypothetical protein